MNAPGMLCQMQQAARESVRSYSWDRVFEEVYAGYRLCLRPDPAPAAEPAFSSSTTS